MRVVCVGCVGCVCVLCGHVWGVCSAGCDVCVGCVCAGVGECGMYGCQVCGGCVHVGVVWGWGMWARKTLKSADFLKINCHIESETMFMNFFVICYINLSIL